MPLSYAEPVSTLNLAEDERWLTAKRIVDSPHFRKSPRLSQLLLYLSEQTLLNRSDLLTEQTIATRVFERDADFNPSVDTIVRSHMVRLRQKLEQYALDNLGSASMQLAIPKGDYIVRFERIAPSANVQTEPEEIAAPALPVAMQERFPGKRKISYLAIACWTLSFIVLVLLGILTMVLRSGKPLEKAQAPPHPLWSKIFQAHQNTTFVAADSGLVLLHRMTRKDTTLAEYLARNFEEETRPLSPERTAEVLNIAERRYTSFVDLNTFGRLQQLAFVRGARLDAKYARDVQMDELKQGNFILSGARGANPWLELYEPELNFVGANDGIQHKFSFINRHPQAGETTEFSVSEIDPRRPVLGVLAFLPNLDGNGNALIIEGNSMAGTEAISDFLFEDAALLPFLEKIKRADGSLPHFEVLVESNSVNGSAGPFHVLAYRTHP
ncbi:helix-turn-helix domain-containing protein [Tunturiibacter lichenicola]|uniref:helix-turn-helix domain-containing protein n=1 Tax=Tunturiibacter lichenicola TaxID=2051959 RepID=UPI003D9ADF6E